MVESIQSINRTDEDSQKSLPIVGLSMGESFNRTTNIQARLDRLRR